MSATSTQARSLLGGLAFSKDTNIVITVLKLLGLMVLDAFGLILIYTFLADDNLGLALVFAVITFGANIIIFVPGLYPIRWMTPGLILVTLLVIYPIFYTVLTAFTNYGDGHLLTKSQSIELIERRRFVPENAPVYNWTVYQSDGGSYALWLTRETDSGLEVAFARVGEEIEEIENPPAEPPEEYEGYRQLDRAARTQALSVIQNVVFGEGDDTAGIANRNQAARPLSQRYVYDSVADTITDMQSGNVYVADNKAGFFTYRQGNTSENLAPGYRVGVGTFNFERFVRDPRLRGPLLDIFVWTVTAAFLSVLTTFSLGLFMALILNDPVIPYRKVIRSLLIIPYAIPGVIGILVWRGMLNQNIGIITNAIANSFIGYRIPWFTDPIWAKVAIILVNLWLGYPYMMLICSGALQAIPSEIYEAAAVDGARPGQRFWKITLPLLLVTVGPLLIASFVYNFNNYLLIELLTRGNPPIPGSPVPAGYTDILISYTYRLAFGSDRGADYGYASAITIIIFLLVASITIFQYRITRTWEQVGENV